MTFKHNNCNLNSFRNYRLVVDEDDLKWVVKEKKYVVIINSFMKIFVLKHLCVGN